MYFVLLNNPQSTRVTISYMAPEIIQNALDKQAQNTQRINEQDSQNLIDY